MQFTISTLAVFGLASIGNAHMIMNTPVPYGKSSLNNSPLDASGSDFPCKQRTGVYEAEGASNSMALGSTQPLKFTGSATHGGGSCQISITYDKAPTKSSKFKVIHSIEGGCPIEGVAGNNGDDANAVDPSTYSFKIPDQLPTGDATLAWTWFNKIGNREMYMNCAPVSIGGGSSKRDEEDLEARNVTALAERDQAFFDSLPDMFVANIGNGCTTVDSSDLAFPDPGDSVEQLGIKTQTPVAPSGTCPTAAAGGSGGGSGSAAPAPTSSAAAAPAPIASSAPAIPGGVFVTTAPPAVGTTLATSASPAPASSTPAASPVESQAPTSAAPATPVSTGTTGSGDALSGACTTEGEWNCIGGTSFQQCASGTWSVAQPLAGGTKCTPGQSSSIDIQAAAVKEKKMVRAVRFSNAHVRRHAHYAGAAVEAS